VHIIVTKLVFAIDDEVKEPVALYSEVTICIARYYQIRRTRVSTVTFQVHF